MNRYIVKPGTMTPVGKDEKTDREERKQIKRDLTEKEKVVADNLHQTIWGKDGL